MWHSTRWSFGQQFWLQVNTIRLETSRALWKYSKMLADTHLPDGPTWIHHIRKDVLRLHTMHVILEAMDNSCYLARKSCLICHAVYHILALLICHFGGWHDDLENEMLTIGLICREFTLCLN